MVIYVDLLIFINTVINYVILLTVEKFMKKPIRLLRLLIASFSCAFFSLLIFIGAESFLLSLFIRISSSAVMALIAYGCRNPREYLRYCCAVIAVSAIYSGMMILFYQLFKPLNMVIVNDILYFEFNPLVLIGVTAVIYLIFSLISKVLSERIRSTVVPLQFRLFGKDYSCAGKIDTGCSLTEPFSNAPVIIVSDRIVSLPDCSPCRVIPYKTIHTASILYGAQAESVSIDHKEIEKTVYIAPIDTLTDGIDAVINSDIIR